MDERDIVLTHIFNGVKYTFDVLYDPYPYTYVTKAMLESGIKTGIFLSALGMEDEEVSEPLQRMPPLIFVNAIVSPDEKSTWEDKHFFEATISCFGFIISIPKLQITDILRMSVVEFRNNVKIEDAISMNGGFDRE